MKGPIWLQGNQLHRVHRVSEKLLCRRVPGWYKRDDMLKRIGMTCWYAELLPDARCIPCDGISVLQEALWHWSSWAWG